MSKKDTGLNISRCRYCDAKVGKGATICSGCHQKLKAVRKLRATLNLIAKPKGKNYDRIKVMSLDEMTKFINDVYKQGYIDCMNNERDVERNEIKEYLESEVNTKLPMEAEQV